MKFDSVYSSVWASICKGSQGQTERAAVLQEEEEAIVQYCMFSVVQFSWGVVQIVKCR
jgi:hypothetical protein